MKRFIRTSLIVVCIVVVATALAGCQMIAQKATEKGIEGASGGKVKINGDSVTIKGNNGDQATISKDTQIPDDFPADVALKDGGSVTAVVTNTTDSGKNYLLGIKYKDPASEVLDYYVNQFKSGDWKTLSTVTTQDGGMVNAENGTVQVTVVVTKESSDGYQSAIQMTVGPKK